MSGGKKDTGPKDAREARLRAALRSNLSRRKAQARARADDGDDDGARTTTEPDQTGQADEGKD